MVTNMCVSCWSSPQVGRQPPSYSCRHPAANVFDAVDCPYELRCVHVEVKHVALLHRQLGLQLLDGGPCVRRILLHRVYADQLPGTNVRIADESRRRRGKES